MKNEIPNLQGLRVMITRPSPLGEMLCNALKKANAKPLHFPTIVVSPPDHPDIFSRQIMHLAKQDWLVFISPLTVFTSAKAIQKQWPEFPAHVRIAAIGGGTAKALRAVNLPVHLFPDEKWSAEGLLELAAFQNVAGMRITIFSGQEGREWLAETLDARGAIVTRAFAFRRSFPLIDVMPIVNKLTDEAIDVVAIASAEALKNLLELLEQVTALLFKLPLLVISERLEALAKELGFQTVLLAKNAAHQSIIDALAIYLQTKKD